MGNNSWREVKLSDLGEVARGRSRHRPRYAEHLYGGEYPFIQTGDIKASEGRISSHEQTYSEAGLAQSRLWPTGTMCITIAANIAETGVLQYPACFPDSVIGFIADKNKADVYYIEYVFRKLRKDIQRQATGSVQDNINLQTFERLKFKVPHVEEQHRIANFLNHFDKKIFLNRQTNQTLEQMAQTLFKSWFVDFDPVIDNALDAGFFEQNLAFSDELLRRVEMRKAVRESDNFKPLPEDIRQLFPDAFEECTESALGLGGWVPKGWGSSPVGSLIELIGGGTPKTSESSYWGGNIPWFSVVDAPNDSDVFVMDTEKKITELGIQNSSAKILKVGTTIISARGTVGKCALVSKPMAINQSCYGIVGKNGIHDYFIYYLIRHSVSHLQQRSHGSVFSTITRDTFSSFNFIFSGQLIANAFGETISFWFEKIARNNHQNYILQNLRDTLLPKLISGELSLNELKTAIPEETLI
ncbi:restriction endonuclease subunit S [Providencia sp. PROV202]|uniref:restriction endonuclease subunit S n=1 Tax=Providencia sp. PROV202 TaxID=2949902 RepID=UPI00234A871D|nr:restriction endonuclease subunit S [Providencia sp. PROV202]